MNNGEIVIACYKPNSGKENETLNLAKGHFSVLSQLGFVSKRAPMLFKSADGTIVEVFEWADASAFKTAHDHPEVAAYWEKMAQVCSFVAPGTMAEMQKAFSHFLPLN